MDKKNNTCEENSGDWNSGDWNSGGGSRWKKVHSNNRLNI